MVYFYKYFGIEIYIIIIIFLIIFAILKYRKAQKLLFTNLFIVIYFNFAFFIFITVWYIHSKILTNKLIFYNNGYQYSLLIISLILLLQFVLMVYSKELFYKMFFPALVNIFLAPLIFFFLKLSIITTVWILIFSISLVGLIYITAAFSSISNILSTSEELEYEKRFEALDMVKEDQNRLLKISLQAALALAASLGVSMSILFQGGALKWDDPTIVLSSMNMVIAFASIVIALIIWMFKPYLHNFILIRNFYEEYYRKNNKSHNRFLKKYRRKSNKRITL